MSRTLGTNFKSRSGAPKVLNLTLPWAANTFAENQLIAKFTIAGVTRHHGDGGVIVNSNLIRHAVVATNMDFRLIIFPENLAGTVGALFDPDLLNDRPVAIIDYKVINAKTYDASAVYKIYPWDIVSPLVFQCEEDSKSLYGYLIAKGAIDEATDENISLQLDVAY